MTFLRDSSVPSDDFFFKENSLLSLFGAPKRSVKSAATKPVVTTSAVSISVSLQDTKKELPFVQEIQHRSFHHSECGSTASSEGHTSDDESVDAGPPGQPDCFPVSGFGRGYMDSLQDVRTHTRAALKSQIVVHDARGFGSIESFAQSRIDNGVATGSFLVCNLADPVRQFHLWQAELPMVEPFYAVKCNPDPAILRVLADLGCGFDCATMGEIDLTLHILDGRGKGKADLRAAAANNIVYANPAKMEHMIDYAIVNGVQMTVFDGEDELYKIAGLEGREKLKLLLRLTTDDKDSVCRFSKKFGCPVEEAKPLLVIAQSLGLNVAGVSFHVGSGCGDAGAYTKALTDARAVFDMAASLDMPSMTVIDIGGGFPGDSTIYGQNRLPDFPELAASIREGIKTFKESTGRQDVRFIAEPGRFFVSACTSIVTKVYSRKGGMKDYQALYVDDGVYGSFNNVVYDHALPKPAKLGGGPNCANDPLIPTAVFGPTCDGLDQMCSLENTSLQRCQVGDWLIWENQGAYTHTASFVFNGYTHVPNKVYCTL